MTMRKKTMEELGRPSIEEFRSHEKLPLVVVADNIRSLHNIGSMFRTCDGFAVEAFWLCGITAVPPNKEIHKTALGAELSVEWKYFPTTCEAVERLSEEGYRIIGVEQAENSVHPVDLPLERGNKYALVFGNEVKGVQQEVLDRCHAVIEIPQRGTKHSLNVAVSAGIVLWEFFKRIM